MNRDSKILVLGASGMVGSAIVTALRSSGFFRIFDPNSIELDLRDGTAVKQFFNDLKPEFIFLAAAQVGGIQANRANPVLFLEKNMAIQNNVISNAYHSDCKKLLFLGSSCIYPRDCPQPIKEESLLSGPLEETNQWYAIAKIAGIKLCQAYRRQYGADFISVMPCNLYGPNDHYDLENSHVLPTLIRRFHEATQSGASEVTCWGTGAPLREFLYVDDCAAACVRLMESYSDGQIINVGSGEEISIRLLAYMIARIVGFKGAIRWDISMPDGTPRKILDSQRLRDLTNWRPLVPLEKGISLAYADFLKRYTIEPHAI